MKMNSQLETNLRQVFKYFNRFMLLNWRLGLGPWISFWPEGFGQFMVITHTGRKTGLRRRTPVNFARVGGEVYCTVGFGPVTDWYRNIMQNPEVEVWLPEERWSAIAEDVSDCPERLPLLREVIRGSGFAGRLFGIDANRLSDEALDEVSRNYRLVHLRRRTPLTGPGGPGDLAWVWPLATLLLLPPALRRRRR